MKLFPSDGAIRRAQVRLVLRFFALMGVLALAWAALLLATRWTR
jgi:hypothetical protein